MWRYKNKGKKDYDGKLAERWMPIYIAYLLMNSMHA